MIPHAAGISELYLYIEHIALSDNGIKNFEVLEQHAVMRCCRQRGWRFVRFEGAGDLFNSMAIFFFLILPFADVCTAQPAYEAVSSEVPQVSSVRGTFCGKVSYEFKEPDVISGIRGSKSGVICLNHRLLGSVFVLFEISFVENFHIKTLRIN